MTQEFLYEAMKIEFEKDFPGIPAPEFSEYLRYMDCIEYRKIFIMKIPALLQAASVYQWSIRKKIEYGESNPIHVRWGIVKDNDIENPQNEKRHFLKEINIGHFQPQVFTYGGWTVESWRKLKCKSCGEILASVDASECCGNQLFLNRSYEVMRSGADNHRHDN